jgi:transcriptional regulator with XRE-family HTH domain
MDIGGRIRAARKAANLSQEELARRAGVPLNRVGRIETGVVMDPHFSTLNSIAEGLGVSVSELLEDERPLVGAR